MTTPNQAIQNPNSTYAATFCAIGVFGSLGLILFHVIGEVSFVSLIGLCLIGSAIVLFQDRLIKADIKGSIELSQIEQARDDVITREENIRRIALILSEITLFTSVTDGMSFPKESRRLRRDWYESKVNTLMGLISSNPEEHANVFKFIDQFKATYFDDHFDAEHTEEGWVKFWAIASADINENKKPN